MDASQQIMRLARRTGGVKAPEVAVALGVSRQAATRHLRQLVAARRLARVGATRGARYLLPSRAPTTASTARDFTATYSTRGLQEDQVFDRTVLRLGLRGALSSHALQTARYAFTEIVNNAIEHSRAPSVRVVVRCAAGDFTFEVVDHGVGAFESLRRKFGLKDHFEAATHLLKGKQTVDPAHHSGQGIFFTSKIADRFVLESARVRLIVDNTVDDVFLEDIRRRPGTRVQFHLKARSRKDLKALFDEYSNAAYEFDKTKVVVHLAARGGEYVSRSEAKRLLVGLDQFRRIILDFKRVRSVGQGFADEIFRVFRASRPEITVEPVHTSPSVAFMIARARRGPAPFSD